MVKQTTPPLTWGLIPLLIVAVIITLNIQIDEDLEAEARSQPPDKADYYIRDAKLSAMGPNGKPLFQVKAGEILHFPDNSAEMTNMTVYYQAGSAGIWQLHSDRGEVPPEADQLKLIGDVRIRGKRPDEGLTQMRMSEVVVLPREGMLRTESPVSIVEPGARMTAVGMQLDILQDVISLSKEVQVRYAW